MILVTGLKVWTNFWMQEGILTGLRVSPEKLLASKTEQKAIPNFSPVSELL